MATTLAALRDRVEQTLRDPTNRLFSTDDVDEGIRQALYAYSQALPYETTSSVAVSSSTREIDLSAITGLIAVTRVWWDYDSSDPQHPPNWRQFELWPGDTLWINDSDEPQAGDTIRLWYHALHTLDGLDGKTSTTIPTVHESTLVIGAAAYAIQARGTVAAENPQHFEWVHRRYADLAHTYQADFNAKLQQLVRQNAARHSGIAPTSSLDRYDANGSGWL